MPSSLPAGQHAMVWDGSQARGDGDAVDGGEQSEAVASLCELKREGDSSDGRRDVAEAEPRRGVQHEDRDPWRERDGKILAAAATGRRAIRDAARDDGGD